MTLNLGSFDSSFSVKIFSYYDFDKVKGEFTELLLSLETIPDSEHRKEEALKMITKKYPAPRKYEKVMSALDNPINDRL